MKEQSAYTRYEKTRIIAARALQIAQGSPVLVKIPKDVIDPVEIAKLEWKAGVIPIDVKIEVSEPVAAEEKSEAQAEEQKTQKPEGKEEAKSK